MSHRGKITLDEAFLRYPKATTFTFGDSEGLCARLLTLVKEGSKRATSMALTDVTIGGCPMPMVGRKDISLDWDGSPALVIETTSVSIQRFCDVKETYALLEGENKDLRGWQEDHQRYFERHGGFDPMMQLICEQFQLIEVF